MARQCRARNGVVARLPAFVVRQSPVHSPTVTSYFPTSDSRRVCFLRFWIGDKVHQLQLFKGLIMKLQFLSNDFEGQLWHQRTADRLGRALGRLHGLVAHIKVRLDDINGPAGGVDKRCSVEILVHGSSPVSVSATARSWQDSVEAVASRIRQRVALHLHRVTLLEHPHSALVPVRASVMAPVAPVARVRSLRRLRLE